MRLREERYALGNEDGGSGEKDGPPSYEDDGSGNKDGAAGRKMDGQNSRMAVRERKIAAREAKKPAIQLKNGPSKQDSRPDRKNEGRGREERRRPASQPVGEANRALRCPCRGAWMICSTALKGRHLK
jgi:hypothetical protein